MRFPIEKIYDGKYVRLYDIRYAEGKHYYNSSRRLEEDLVLAKTDSELKSLVPDAVSCVVILEQNDVEPHLLLAQEYRYPVGRYVLSVPAGLIDAEDVEYGRDKAIRNTAIRELKEETGITFKDGDELEVISPMLFSSPGMTDENNAMVRLTIHDADLSELTQDGSEGPEMFDGFELLTVSEAEKLLEQGCDNNGLYYAVYTWIALADFVRKYKK